MLSRHREAAAYQSTQLTARLGHQILDDLEGLHVEGARIAERGETYLVFAPERRQVYTSTTAVTLAIVTALFVLILTAFTVILILLLPLALLPFVPLALDDRPQLAVGAVPDDISGSATRVTVHGRVWSDLGVALDAYLGHLPQPGLVVPPDDAEPAATGGSPARAAASSPAAGAVGADTEAAGNGSPAT